MESEREKAGEELGMVGKNMEKVLNLINDIIGI
jgi:hypothetical protein